MERFLKVSSAVFLVSGLFFLLSPKIVKKAMDLMNRTLYDFDSKFSKLRRFLGIFFLLVALYLLYILLYKL